MESVHSLETTTFCGRRFTRAQLARIQETVEAFPNLSRHALASTLCEHLDWTTPKGSYKISSCLKLLDELERLGMVVLPAKRKKRVQVPTAIELKKPEAEIRTGLEDLGRIVLQEVKTGDRALWKSYVESHHYLGYKRPVGAHLLYFIVSEALNRKLGCVSFAAAQVRILAARDQWIGWDTHHREKLLRLVLCQSRFLIFPWVRVENLGSKVLALSAKQVGDDWVRIHGYRPVLIETFVDTSKFSGASYRAANWQYLGETQGRGRDPKRESTRSPKAIFAYPLQSNWRQCLTQGHRAVELKKRYRNDLQSSRTRSVGDGFVSMWNQVVHILHDVAAQYDATWRVRKRVIDSLILMLLIFRLVTSKNSQSYGATIDDLWDSCDKLGLCLPQQNSIAPSSFCAARKKLHEDIFKCVNQRILNTYAPETSKDAWRGHRLFGVDGSKLNLPRELIACGYKTPSDNAHYPQGLLSCLSVVAWIIPKDALSSCFSTLGITWMPHKFNAARRHKFDKAQYRVINWAEYNESLRQRGDLTIWVSEEAQSVWSAPRRTSRGGQRRYSDLAIEACLTLRTAYRLGLRQTQGLMGSIGTLMGLDIRVPDYSTLSRRANGLSIAQAVRQAGSVPVHLVVDSTGLKIFGEGEWLAQKHKTKGIRRRWRKLHLGLDLASGAIVCANLTHDDVGDSTALPGLLDQLDAQVTGFLADGAYDGASTRDLLRERYGETLDVVIPPPKNAVTRPQSARDPTVRDRHIAQIRSNGRMAWQAATGYNQRSRIETQIGRWKGVIGPKLKSRSFSRQITEIQVGQKVLNTMTALGRPVFERIA